MKKIKIIAEAGINHNGNLALAEKLIDMAANSSADYIKFQTFKTEKIVDKEVEMVSYQKKGDSSKTQFEMIKKTEFNKNEFMHLKNYSLSKGIKFLTTIADIESTDLIDDLDLDLVKVGSGDFNNLQLLKKIVEKEKPILLSTGMASLTEIKSVINKLKKYGISDQNLNIMFCVSEYPTPPNNANIRAISFLKNELGVNISYSDHTLGSEAAVLSTFYNPNFIEKHITLDKNMNGPDHKMSQDPIEFNNYVRSIRIAETILNSNGLKVPTESEIEIKKLIYKKFFANKDISKNEILNDYNIIGLRTNKEGIDVDEYDEIIGKKTLKTIKKGVIIKKEYLR